MTGDPLAMLSALLEQAERERDATLAARRRALDAEHAALQQLEQLLAWRTDSERRWRGPQAGRQDAALLAHGHGFATRLTQAIELQREQAALLAEQRERIEVLLAERELKLASTAKLIERRRADEARVAARHERRLDDELAARAARLWLQASLHGGLS